MPPVLAIYAVTNPDVRAALVVADPDTTVPSVKKMAIKDAVEKALQKYGTEPPHRFGMSDDDPNNVVLAISGMRATMPATAAMKPWSPAKANSASASFPPWM